LETVAHVALRLTAGFEIDEVAVMCERERATFRHLALPEKPISKAWVSARMRDLKGRDRGTRRGLVLTAGIRLTSR